MSLGVFIARFFVLTGFVRCPKFLSSSALQVANLQIVRLVSGLSNTDFFRVASCYPSRALRNTSRLKREVP